jgi:hypothetical protein
VYPLINSAVAASLDWLAERVAIDMGVGAGLRAELRSRAAMKGTPVSAKAAAVRPARRTTRGESAPH